MILRAITPFHLVWPPTIILAASLGTMLLAIDVPNVLATPITVSGNINSFRDTRSLNDVGIGQGDVNQFGAGLIPSLGTTIRGTQGTFTTGLIPCQPLAVDATFCATAPPFSLDRTGSWNLTFQNGPDVAAAVTPSLAGIPAEPVPFPSNVTISGTGTTPTLNWTVPTTFTPDAVRVVVFDKGVTLANGMKDVILATSLPANQSSFQIPAGTLQPNGQYVLGVQLIETRGHAALPPNAPNTDIFRRSFSFFEFSPLTGATPVLLPTVGPAPDPATGLGPTYQFNVAGVRAGQAIFIDPMVAIGYKYAIGAGNPNFASVNLPVVGDNIFTLSYLLEGDPILQQIIANTQFFFPSGGVSAFDVTGIETSAMLDPNNVTAFITGLTFVADGDFTGTMTPLVIEVSDLAPIPEPATFLLFGTTAAGLALARWRRRKQS